jgi:hypothetical protein
MMMIQPYRLLARASDKPQSCLDPPRADCEAPSGRLHGRLKIAALGALVLFTVSGLAVASVHRGRIEISPSAVTHAQKKTPSKKPLERKPTPTKEDPTASRLSPIQPWLGGIHDTKKVLERARALESVGMDMTVIDIPLADPVADSAGYELWPAKSLPIYDSAGSKRVGAIEVRALPRDSALRVAGFQDGDELLGVDGYRFDDGSIYDLDVLALRARGALVAEIARGQHHLALSIHWHTRSADTRR